MKYWITKFLAQHVKKKSSLPVFETRISTYSWCWSICTDNTSASLLTVREVLFITHDGPNKHTVVCIIGHDLDTPRETLYLQNVHTHELICLGYVCLHCHTMFILERLCVCIYVIPIAGYLLLTYVFIYIRSINCAVRRWWIYISE